MNDFSQFLYTRRKALGLTQQNIADKLNITNKAVSKWESGECFPETAQLVALADILECTVDELLRGRFAEKETAISAEENAQKNLTESPQNTGMPRTFKPWTIGIFTGIGLLAFGILSFFLFIIAFGNTNAVAVWAIGILLFFVIAAVIAFICAGISYALIPEKTAQIKDVPQSNQSKK